MANTNLWLRVPEARRDELDRLRAELGLTLNALLNVLVAEALDARSRAQRAGR